MTKMQLSLIITVFNEQNTILQFIKSVFNQSRLPDEIVIVDGGSTDNTVSVISNFSKKIKLIIKKGNRAVGRNEAIRNATGEIILCSDAGCILDKNWVKNIIKPFDDKKVDVVAGYYRGLPKTIFQKCLIPYVLVMEDKVNPAEFLPASRSMAFRKRIWKNIGGFDEKFSHNEDYVFAKRLKKIGANIVFNKKAIVNWIPRNNIKEVFKMFFRFAFGDSEAGILRNKVLYIFARYIFYLYLIALSILIKSPYLLSITISFPLIYFFWAIKKNYKYINDKRAFYILPLLQVVSDTAVLGGTKLGLIKTFTKIDYFSYVKKNFLLLSLVFVYVGIMTLVISSGIPNQNHPFTYQMDEWHQAQSVRNVFKFGSPNMEGSANGTMFHFFITGVMLAPFYLFGIIDPFAIKSSVDSIADQEKLFVVLRVTTLFFGIFTLFILSKISRLLKTNTFLTIFLFTFTPMWLVLSNFFKYDIALVFWITLSFYFFINYAFSPDIRNFILACVFSAIAFSVKVSGLPLLLIIILAFLIFTPKFNKKYLRLFLGLLIFIFTSIFLGFPDLVFGGRNMDQYLYENILGSSLILQDYNLKESLLSLTLLHKFPAIFGKGFYILSIISVFYFLLLTFNDFRSRKYQDFKIKLFILLSFVIFFLSLVPLGITISANRSLVLLPFLVVINGIALKNLNGFLIEKKLIRIICIIFITAILTLQTFESYLWIRLKVLPSPQELSSKWIIENVKRGSDIGLENIPIYQFEPDFILKEFYNKQYHSNIDTVYNYFVIDKNTDKLPEYIVLSNVNYERKYLKTSFKNDLVKRLEDEKYAKIGYFPLFSPSYYPYLGLFSHPDGISIYKKQLTINN